VDYLNNEFSREALDHVTWLVRSVEMYDVFNDSHLYAISQRDVRTC